MPIIDKYNQRADKVNSLVCVGLDSDFEKIPERFKKMENPQFEFNKWIIDQTHEYAAAFKANIAFYDARGDQGLRELKMTQDYLVEKYPDIFRVCDSKRGDIGNTNNGYVEELFDWLDFDAITLHPYFGKESLMPFLDRADKGCIILCRSSNPGAGELQDLLVDGKPLWKIVAEKTQGDWNFNNNCLLMVGATVPKEAGEARKIIGDMTILMPGIGAQGGDVEAAVKAGMNSEKKGLIINSSRGIIFVENPAEEAKKLRDEINKYR
ncbi:MAG: orotidine 5'-phosphate decarboxylase [Candidatus Moranbacteria bacterium RIFOXYB1_FULL_43_19]|nr:MAG: orotidine 5'-phosphate decarboxylase [Candidatus Moranbacteria bacterium RIFOXYB1_FULL_43_19]OGI27900.1 MAG: orotidine 5'-phosphate decarboxylase [Candidatus Moranbacteria bacterium RIFOXYA1_FULL_44_7]OGI32515.1 MAG: orotidine 5'-phosphate decarboxylase [Candidatus Moranbacteria bacterium RIFOXYC1_FULL_44_13]OGI38137.1 MAG: orotidine 5'-phosphate decarboxylase [Candidatus Moranbacteria bacterium RIFOXYD1_FULL_44_12]